MADDLDEQLRHAMANLDRQTPAGYFDTLADRTLARLDDAAPADFVAEEVAEEIITEDEVIGERDEHSGLQDIRNLASETKARLARRTSQQLIARDDRIASSSAGWKAVALPDPARRAAPGASVVPIDELARERAARARQATPVAAPVTSLVARPPLAAQRRRWVAIAGAAVAAAAGVMIFWSARGADQARAPSAAGSAPAATMRPVEAVQSTPTSNGMNAASPRPAPAISSNVGSAANAGSADDPASGHAAKPADRRPTKPSVKGKPVGKLGKMAAPDPQLDEPDVKPPPVGKPVSSKPVGKRAAAQGSDEPSFDELVHEAGIGSAAPAPPKLDRQSLSPDDIKRGLGAVAGQARACFTGTEGVAAVRLTVAPTGKVTKVTTTGPFAGTPTAACVERAVKSATFPPWDGGPQSVAYSYLLSE